jgi:uncharacterized protein (DUF1501 family)
MPLQPSRRELFHHTGLAALGLFWSRWLAAEASTPARRAKARAVILIFNAGAPSHLDLWDPKPDAPDTVRGPYRPIATSAPGVRISELLPRLGKLAHRYAVVRSVHHTHTQHNSGMYWSIVGRPYRIDNTLINPSRIDYPSFGTLVGWLAQRDGYSGALPPYVITPAPHCDSTVYITPGQFGGCLGSRFDPFVLNSDPNNPNFRIAGFGLPDEMSVTRLAARRQLLDRLGKSRVETEFESNRVRALELVRSAEVRRAFDLSREPASIRDRYGRHSWGQSHLLARRLIEAGVRFVTTVNGPSISWDTHDDNFRKLKERLVPPMEMGFAALLDDLAERGLLDTTLVVWMGDFGRTPIINKQAGRDHWPQCYTMVLAGGGIKGGIVVGESDRQGAFPKSQPVTPADVHATVFTALGYDPHRTMYLSPEGRPFPLSEGEPIRQLLS